MMTEQTEQTFETCLVEIKRVEVEEHSNPRLRFDEAKLDELAQSIRAVGVIEPLVVRRRGPRLVLVCGERRLRAARRAGLREVPCVVREMTDAQAVELALVENLQRVGLRPLEEAYALRRMRDDLGHSVAVISERVGRSVAYVYQMLGLTELPLQAQDALDAGRLVKSVAAKIAELPTKELMLRATRECVKPTMRGERGLRYVAALKEEATGVTVQGSRTREVAGGEYAREWRRHLLSFDAGQFAEWKRHVAGRETIAAFAEAVERVMTAGGGKRRAA